MASNNPFRTETYIKDNSPLLAGWRAQQFLHISFLYPDRTPERINAFLDKIIETRMIEPELGRVSFPEPGRPVKEKVPVLKHVAQIENLITAPSGNSYLPPRKKESFIRVTLKANKKARSAFKKQMLAAKEEGDVGQTKRFNNLQSSAKIKNNSVPGMMQSKFNIINDSSGFNAITSVSRLFVRSAYGHGERMLSGSVFLPSYDDALSFIYLMIEVMPANTGDVMRRFGLKTINVEDCCDWLVKQVSNYAAGKSYRDRFMTVLSKLTPVQLTFIFCGGSFYNLFLLNVDLFRGWIDKIFSHDTVTIDPNSDPTDIFKLESTLSVLVRSPNTDRLGLKANGNVNTMDEALADNPDGVRWLTALGHQVEAGIDEFADIISTFIRLEADIPQSFHNGILARDQIIGCDTDSNIFSTAKTVQLYHDLEEGRIVFNRKTYEVNALTVYFLSRSIEHVFARMSINFGAEQEDKDEISMKNEYLFVVFCRTNIAKHYAALITQQEGKLLPEAEIEAKGVNLIGSTRSGEVTTRLKSFMTKTFEDIIKTDGQLSCEAMIDEVAGIEQELLAGFEAGDISYLTITSVKPEADDTDSTRPAYFYYELWEEVFAPYFNVNVVLPNRMFKVNVVGEDKLFKNPEFIAWMQKEYPDLYQRLDGFIRKKGRYPSYFLIAPGFEEIPEFFRKWMDKRRMVFDNLAPFYLFLSSFGISTAWRKNDLLLSDFR